MKDHPDFAIGVVINLLKSSEIWLKINEKIFVGKNRLDAGVYHCLSVPFKFQGTHSTYIKKKGLSDCSKRPFTSFR